MTEAGLAIVRRVVLCVGLLIGTLLFIYPHWSRFYSVDEGVTFVSHDIGRNFITGSPLPIPSPDAFSWVEDKKPVRIYRVRQFAEVAIALLFTFGLMRALRLKKPEGD